ncbi:MAG: hypothetical protein SOT71_13795 [Romboutsia timonensis]|uniref:type III toxin-antitoxin system TenpIN family toxin n=1 Tax=Romboutsia timonensis TaxID=1776391 RepID=UPI002A75B53B|nr:hypothetical protein [Romboutsia timonensis]MDY2883718.1 hypothetical protein [Romboutsia timonensis]
MKYIYLTNEFYEKYKDCKEIEKKETRPYAMVLTRIDDVTWAVPLRSNIPHKYVIWSDKPNKCGLDLSKAVVIEDVTYISEQDAQIRQNEFNELKGKEHILYTKLKSYMNTYLKAYARQDIKRNRELCQFSTLQYFHKYIKAFKQTDAGEAAME